MQCSVEISMYPLHKNYKPLIINFIKRLRSYPQIKITTNGMSTQLFGSYELVMNMLNTEIGMAFKDNKSIVFNIKIVNSDLKEIPNF
jgi:uncharacterized protein YqgV (UPF0045/DUF77 family)|tara:strand:- start:286 stop:546 length:261 start_codon:yes stop_codon:yes gene_type:complete